MHLEAKPRSEGRLSSHGPLMGPSRVPRGLVVGIEEPAAHFLRAAVAQDFLVTRTASWVATVILHPSVRHGREKAPSHDCSS